MVKCMAHRGWSAKAPENTLSAIKLALMDECVDSIEVDVQLTKDGIPVVFHDFTLERTTNGTGYVKDLTLEEIKMLDAGSWFSVDYIGESIPTLEEVLQLVRGSNKLLNLELKAAGGNYPDIEFLVVKLVERMNMIDNVILTSFDHEVMKKAGLLADEITTGLIVLGNPVMMLDQLIDTGASVLSIAYPYLTTDLVLSLEDKGFTTIAWTVDDVFAIDELKRKYQNITICTNYPNRVRTSVRLAL